MFFIGILFFIDFVFKFQIPLFSLLTPLHNEQQQRAKKQLGYHFGTNPPRKSTSIFLPVIGAQMSQVRHVWCYG